MECWSISGARPPACHPNNTLSGLIVRDDNATLLSVRSSLSRVSTTNTSLQPRHSQLSLPASYSSTAASLSVPCAGVQVKSVATVPIVANGDVFSPSTLDTIHTATGVDGLMSARGLLANPALFTHPTLPLSAVTTYLRLAEQYGGRYSLHHHHLQFMVGGRGGLSRAERMEFSGLRTLAGCREWMTSRGWLDGENEQANTGGVGAGALCASECLQHKA